MFENLSSGYWATIICQKWSSTRSVCDQARGGCFLSDFILKGNLACQKISFRELANKSVKSPRTTGFENWAWCLASDRSSPLCPVLPLWADVRGGDGVPFSSRNRETPQSMGGYRASPGPLLGQGKQPAPPLLPAKWGPAGWSGVSWSVWVALL